MMSNKFPWQRYKRLKSVSILDLWAYFSNASLVTANFCYQIVTSLLKCNFSQILEKLREQIQSHLMFSQIKVAWIRSFYNFLKLERKLHKILTCLSQFENKYGGHRTHFRVKTKIKDIFYQLIPLLW